MKPKEILNRYDVRFYKLIQIIRIAAIHGNYKDWVIA